MMKTFPEDTEFKFAWRPYQARVLGELSDYLGDDRLHIVAAPGSGKTVLGLEVVRRINQPTLVLAPTLAIRNQWVQRLVEIFLPEEEDSPDWISQDLRFPRFFTVTTYQALHSAYSDKPAEPAEDSESEEQELEKEAEDTDAQAFMWLDDSGCYNVNRPIPSVVESLKAAGIKTVVVDEAHHLRTNWWRSLTSVLEGLEQPKVLALTATPPFDVPAHEWERYVELCGPVDAQVPVPELVIAGNLCPHQDLVVFSVPSDAESEEITKFRREVARIKRILENSEEFANHLLEHDWIKDPESHIESILEEPELFSSILVFLNHIGVEVPLRVVEIVADSPRLIPNLNDEWLETLLTGILYPPGIETPKLSSFLEEIRDELRRIGALDRRRIELQDAKTIEKILKRSISKLSKISEIADLELESLGDDLRMVILTDFIRKEFLPKNDKNEQPLTKIGVVPIFETIRRKHSQKAKIGILSGSLVVLPEASRTLLQKVLRENDISQKDISIKPLANDKAYVRFEMRGSQKQKIVRVMTDLFAEGGVNILVGTKSLLGEGWDAPSINSLVIASFVGSYMLSNQMRGRAIRTQRGKPDKTSNIWHLVCVEPDTDYPGEDYETMVRRFKAFVGVSFAEPVIENGLGRLDVGKPPFSKRDVKSINNAMYIRAENREYMRGLWDEALARGEEGMRLVEDIQAQKIYLPRGFVFKNTISALLWNAIAWSAYFLAEYMRGIGEAIQGFPTLEGLLLIVLVGAIIAALILLPGLLKALWLLIRNGPVKSSMKQVGTALLKTLCHIGEIRTKYHELRIVVEEQEYGFVYCHIEGGRNREKSVYLEALQEILNPIENPRYLLVRRTWLRRKIARTDYHAVPTVIGTKKMNAECFADMWKKHVGRMDLVYTRTRKGRSILLKARSKSLSSAFRPKSERITRWK
ncbi:MAG: DEAD/DEAH box helicase family protein [Candidatus Thorarchaeota archaeon]